MDAKYHFTKEQLVELLLEWYEFTYYHSDYDMHVDHQKHAEEFVNGTQKQRSEECGPA